jgi:hypothetical protein
MNKKEKEKLAIKMALISALWVFLTVALYYLVKTK